MHCWFTAGPFSLNVIRYPGLTLHCQPAGSTGIAMHTIISSVSNENFASFPTIISFYFFFALFLCIILTLICFLGPQSSINSDPNCS